MNKLRSPRRVFHIFHEVHREIENLKSVIEHNGVSDQSRDHMLGYVQSWMSVVEVIVEGYDACFDEYRNWIAHREYLEWKKKGKEISKSCKAQFWRTIGMIDEEFIRNTFPVERHFYGRANSDGEFWYRRLPNKLPPALEEGTQYYRSCSWTHPFVWLRGSKGSRVLRVGVGPGPYHRQPHPMDAELAKWQWLPARPNPKPKPGKRSPGAGRVRMSEQHVPESLEGLEEFILEHQEIAAEVDDILAPLKRWMSVVEEIADGYPHGLEQYLVDVDVRYVLEHIGEFRPKALSDGFLSIRDFIDGVFMSVTAYIDRHVGGAEDSNFEEFWLRRLPLILLPALEEETRPLREPQKS